MTKKLNQEEIDLLQKENNEIDEQIKELLAMKKENDQILSENGIGQKQEKTEVPTDTTHDNSKKTSSVGGEELPTAYTCEFVDLGLPSGTLWAKCNYGAKSETENGNYYNFEEAQKLPITPTKKQFEELLEYTESKWVTVNGVNGRLFTSKKNNNSIFLPACGSMTNGYRNGLRTYGCYWSSNLCGTRSGNAWRLGFHNGNVYVNQSKCDLGRPVRGVKK